MRRILMVVVAPLVVAMFAGGFATAVSAQETTGSAGEDPLTRYDDALTKQLQSDYDALKKEEEAYLEENPSAGFYEDEKKANDLADARMRAIENAPVPGSKKERAEELRRQAESLYALQSWADSAGVNVNSDVYWGGAERVAEDYEAEAEALEEEVAAEEAAEKEEERAAEEEVAQEETAEAPEETTGAAAGGGGGQADAAEEPPSQKLEGGEDELGEAVNSGGGVNLVPVAVLAAFALAVGGLFAARRYGGLGGLREAVGERLSGLPRAPKPRGPAKSRQVHPREAAGKDAERPGAVTEPREAPRGGEGREGPSGAASGRVTPAVKPTATAETGSTDAEALAEWFSKEAPEPERSEEKKESRRGERRRRRRGGDPEDVPGEAPQQDRGHAGEAPRPVGEMVAEEVARMRASGELGPKDEVVVTVEGGRIKVRKKKD